MFGSDVQHQPSHLQSRIGDRYRHDPHPGVEESAVGARVPRLAWQCGVPGRRVRPPRRRDQAGVDGKTDIENGVTYSKFETAPDAPFTRFETVLPAGPHRHWVSIHPGARTLQPVRHKLVMPTKIIAQNNNVIEQETPVTTTGCSGVKPARPRSSTLAQRYLKALKNCRNRYKHNKRKRTRCEHKAHPPTSQKPSQTAATTTNTQNTSAKPAKCRPTAHTP